MASLVEYNFESRIDLFFLVLLQKVYHKRKNKPLNSSFKAEDV